MMGTLASLRTMLILVLALSLAGCGDSVLEPNPPGGTNDDVTGGDDPALTGPEILVIEEEQPVRYMKVQTEPVDETGTTPGPRQLHVEALIDGTVGGKVQCGRFLLSIPAGAFDGEGTVSMTMPDETVMVVDIEISPATLNNFNEQVKLCLLTDDTGLDEEDLQIYWWDPDQAEWKGLGCDRDLSDDVAITGTTEGILTNLSHFSRYSGGKAGW